MSAPFSFNVQRTNSGHGTSDTNSLRKATLMDNPIRWILKRIAERIVPLVGDALAGTLATMLSLGRAEQQNELEEAARRYDAEDKPQIAQALRQQASKLAACDPAADARQIGASLALDEQDALPAPGSKSASKQTRLPDFSAAPSKSRKKKTRNSDADGNAATGDES
jgi:hypothetical protein